MSLFDRYDKNNAELFLRDTCFVSTPERRFEDLFDQIHQHFPSTRIFSNSEECLKHNEEIMKTIHYKSVKILELLLFINMFMNIYIIFFFL